MKRSEFMSAVFLGELVDIALASTSSEEPFARTEKLAVAGWAHVELCVAFHDNTTGSGCPWVRAAGWQDLKGRNDDR